VTRTTRSTTFPTRRSSDLEPDAPRRGQRRPRGRPEWREQPQQERERRSVLLILSGATGAPPQSRPRTRAKGRLQGATMIIVSVLYPNVPKARFDVDYYTRKHMPIVLQRLGTPLQRVVVVQGI